MKGKNLHCDGFVQELDCKRLNLFYLLFLCVFLLTRYKATELELRMSAHAMSSFEAPSLVTLLCLPPLLLSFSFPLPFSFPLSCLVFFSFLLLFLCVIPFPFSCLVLLFFLFFFLCHSSFLISLIFFSLGFFWVSLIIAESSLWCWWCHDRNSVQGLMF